VVTARCASIAGMLWPPASLEACENSLTSDLPRTHFDWHPINRERPLSVELGCVICRPTNDAKLDREPNVDPMLCAKPHRRPSFRMLSPPGASDPSSAPQARTFLRSWPPQTLLPVGGARRARLTESEVGDSLQFLSALLAPANSSARLCQASAPTNPRSLPDTNCFNLGFEKTVRLSHSQGAVQQPWPCLRTFSDCHKFGAYPQCLAERPSSQRYGAV
jgi:hypothetical protein